MVFIRKCAFCGSKIERGQIHRVAISEAPLEDLDVRSSCHNCRPLLKMAREWVTDEHGNVDCPICGYNKSSGHSKICDFR